MLGLGERLNDETDIAECCNLPQTKKRPKIKQKKITKMDRVCLVDYIFVCVRGGGESTTIYGDNLNYFKMRRGKGWGGGITCFFFFFGRGSGRGIFRSGGRRRRRRKIKKNIEEELKK